MWSPILELWVLTKWYVTADVRDVGRSLEVLRYYGLLHAIRVARCTRSIVTLSGTLYAPMKAWSMSRRIARSAEIGELPLLSLVVAVGEGSASIF